MRAVLGRCEVGATLVRGYVVVVHDILGWVLYYIILYYILLYYIILFYFVIILLFYFVFYYIIL